MSANNQVLVKEYEGRWYVFNNIQAESWCDDNGEHENELYLDEAHQWFDTKEDAIIYAHKLDEQFDEEWGMPNSEYGVHFNLAKDGADVKILK